MKRISTLLTAAAVFLAGQSKAQTYTESFEGGFTPACAPLTNAYTTTTAGEIINGTGSLYSNPPVNSSGTRDYSSPFLNIASTALTISYWYKLNTEINAANTTRTIEVGLLSTSGIYTSLQTLTINKNTTNQTTPQLYTTTATAPSTGIYRLVVKMGGNNGSGTVRIILDDITINAAPYYSTTCNQASTLTNDVYIGTVGKSFTSTNSVLANDGADPEGEARTISIATQSPDGTVTIAPDGNFVFTPNVGFIGTTTTFTYQVCDNGFPSACASAQVIINFVDNITLPVKLMSFGGNVNTKNSALLRWSVAENETGDHFQVLRSADGKSFTEAGMVFISGKVGAESYTYTDSRELDAITYYKLKIVNKDGSVSYSNVIALKSAATQPASGITIMKNPVESTLTFTYTAATATQGQVSIYNTAGLKVYSSRLNSQKGTNALSLHMDSHMASGVYILEVVNGTERAVARMLKK